MQSGASYRWLTLAATVGMTWLLWQQGRDHYVEEEPLEPEPQNG